MVSPLIERPDCLFMPLLRQVLVLREQYREQFLLRVVVGCTVRHHTNKHEVSLRCYLDFHKNSSTNKNGHHNISEMLLKVTLNIHNPIPTNKLIAHLVQGD